MNEEIKIIKNEILKIFSDENKEHLSFENVYGNELMQRILDSICEFQEKYELN